MKLILPKKAKNLLAFFQKQSIECYLVGGFIRDYLLNSAVTSTANLDFTTEATPEQILTFFPEGKYENQFGTVILPLNKIASRLNLKPEDYVESDYFEVTTFRSEKGYLDRRHPDQIVWGKTINEDLQRRDFTINALATRDGEKILDLFQGQADLKNRIIRTVGKPEERFDEDALRLLRAVRFASTLNFQIEEKTLLALCKNWQNLSFISWERIRDEFFKILSGPHPKQGVQLLKDTNLLVVFLPELLKTVGVGQKSPQRHHIYDVYTHSLETLAACPNPDPIVRLACLLHDIGKPITRQVLETGVVTFYNHEIVGTDLVYEIGKRLRLTNKDLARLTKLVRYHQFVVSEQMTDNALRRFIREVGTENILAILDLRLADRLGSGSKASSWRLDLFKKRLVEVQKEPFLVKDLKISGQDVLKLFNISPSPRVGRILKSIFAKVEKHELENNRETLLSFIKNNQSSNLFK
jgi:putative nucleotidyltransferase with HDIG domain